MRRAELLFLRVLTPGLAAYLVACASGPATSKPKLPAEASSSSKAVREEFDPRSIQEDLLLIQPAFPRPSSNSVREEIPFEPGAPPPPPPLVATELEVVDAQPENVDAGPVYHTETITEKVFRIQIMALSKQEIAQDRAQELQEALDVPVYVVQQRHLYVVRVGNFADRRDANRLKNELAAMHPDYQDAYVVADEHTRNVKVPTYDDPVTTTRGIVGEKPESERPQSATVLVPASGWRVLLDQFLSNDEAVKLQRRATRHLGRSDINVVFKAPWYKVEMGNFRTEAEAQEWVENIKSKGYPSALKVRGQILLLEGDH